MKHKCDGCEYKGEHQEMMFRPFGVCLREISLGGAVQNYNAEVCPYSKTNADNIRSMNDEELAEFLQNFHNDDIGMDEICHAGLCLDDEDCVECTLKWLKQPMKEH